MFTSAHLHLCSSSHPHIISAHLHILTSAGGSAAGAPRNATLCRDRACRAREMQARVRFGFVRRNPLRRSCVSSGRNAGESAICPGPGQPSAEIVRVECAEIVRVECAKCRRECDLPRSRATLCGDRACRVREMQARAPVRDNPLRSSCVSSAKCRRECDSVLSRATICGDRACRWSEMQAGVRLGSWKMRTGDFVVQL